MPWVRRILAMNEPSDLREALGEIRQWQIDHQEADMREFAQRPTKDEMKNIVHDALVDFFTNKGLLTKNVLVTTAMIVGALVVIGGGFKWLLGLFGFIISRT